ncbi:MAG: Rap1a/Tai family immunity protein [Pseudomonadota bacterium]
MNKFMSNRSKLSRSSAPHLLAFSLLFPLLPSPVVAEQTLSIDKITADSVNLSARQFFQSYMSTDANERKSAELYLLGVMDTTEGKVWCDYRTFKTITLRERIFEEFKKLNSSHLDERASSVIERILTRRYPCGRKK